jgi:hypothetical protein
MKNIKESLNLVTIVLVAVVGGAAFFGGIKYQQNKIPAMGQGQFATGENPFSGRGRNQTAETQVGVGQKRMGNGQVAGEITSVADNSITVKMIDGSSKIVILGDSIAVSKSTEAQKDELKVGVKVSVFGTPNTDGSVTGQSIELEPAFLGQMDKVTSTPTK